MDECLTRQMAAINGIRGTSSYVVLRIVKRQHRFASFWEEEALESHETLVKPLNARIRRKNVTKTDSTRSGRGVRRHAQAKSQ
jgi:hypothetical protein